MNDHVHPLFAGMLNDLAGLGTDGDATSFHARELGRSLEICAQLRAGRSPAFQQKGSVVDCSSGRAATGRESGRSLRAQTVSTLAENARALAKIAARLQEATDALPNNGKGPRGRIAVMATALASIAEELGWIKDDCCKSDQYVATFGEAASLLPDPRAEG